MRIIAILLAIAVGFAAGYALGAREGAATVTFDQLDQLLAAGMFHYRYVKFHVEVNDRISEVMVVYAKDARKVTDSQGRIQFEFQDAIIFGPGPRNFHSFDFLQHAYGSTTLLIEPLLTSDHHNQEIYYRPNDSYVFRQHRGMVVLDVMERK